MENMISQIHYILLTVTYWGTIVAIWFCVQSYGKLDPLIYMVLAIGVVVALVIQAGVIPQIKVGYEIVMGLLWTWKLRERRRYTRTKLRKSKLALKRVCALSPLLVYYGPFFALQPGFVVEYFSTMLEQVVNMVMMENVNFN